MSNLLRRRMLLARGKKYLKNYTIYGNSVVDGDTIKGVGDEYRWNQEFNSNIGSGTQILNGITVDKYSSYIVANGVATASSRFYVFGSLTLDAQHKYFIKFTPQGGSHTTFYAHSSDWKFQDLGDGALIQGVGSLPSICASFEAGCTVVNLVFAPTVFDLTAMGIADRINTIEDFKAYLVSIGKMQSVDDEIPYFPYDAGSTFTNLPIVARGNNLFDGTMEEGIYSIADGTPSAPISNRSRCANPIRVKENTTYYLSSKYPVGENRILCYSGKNADSNSYLGNVFHSTNGFTTLAGTNYIRFYFATNPIENPQIQIEEGSTPTPYVPYRRETFPESIQSPLYGTSENADELDYKLGGITRNIGHCVFDRLDGRGHAGETTAFGGTDTVAFYRNLPYYTLLGSVAIFPCNNLGVYGTKTEAVYVGQYVAVRLKKERLIPFGFVDDDDTTYAPAMMAWLEALNHPFYLALRTPTFEPLDLPKIESFDGIQITTDTEVLPSKVEIEL